MNALSFYACIAACALGIFIQSVLPVPTSFLYFGTLCGTALIILGRKKSEAPSALLMVLCGLFLCLMALGAARTQIAEMQFAASSVVSEVGKEATVSGVIVSEPEASAQSLQAYLKSGTEKFLVRADRTAQLSYGEAVTVRGTLEDPESFDTKGGRMFDYPGYLKAHGVHHIIAFAHVTKTGAFKGNPVLRVLYGAKHAFMNHLERVLPVPQSGLGEGLLLGVKQALGTELEDDFRKVGVTHIIVLSGYNIMLVVAFVMYVLSLFLPVRLRLIFGAFAVLLFALMVGPSATVIRASAMALLFLFAKAIGRTYAVLRALMLTGICMLLLNPFLLVFDIGFQLSFLATLGLILLAPFVESKLALVPTHAGLREFVTATISAQIMVTPILLYQMGQFSVVSIVVNVLVLPVVPIAMLLTACAGFCALISYAFAIPFAFLANLSLIYIISVVRIFAALPFAAIVVPVFPFYIVVATYAALAFLLWRLRTRVPAQSYAAGWTIVDEAAFKEAAAALPSDAAAVPHFFRN